MVSRGLGAADRALLKELNSNGLWSYVGESQRINERWADRMALVREGPDGIIWKRRNVSRSVLRRLERLGLIEVRTVTHNYWGARGHDTGTWIEARTTAQGADVRRQV